MSKALFKALAIGIICGASSAQASIISATESSYLSGTVVTYDINYYTSPVDNYWRSFGFLIDYDTPAFDSTLTNSGDLVSSYNNSGFNLTVTVTNTTSHPWTGFDFGVGLPLGTSVGVPGEYYSVGGPTWEGWGRPDLGTVYYSVGNGSYVFEGDMSEAAALGFFQNPNPIANENPTNDLVTVDFTFPAPLEPGQSFTTVLSPEEVENTFTITGAAVPLASAAPEPAAWTLMLVGVAALGGCLRRRRGAVPSLA